MPPGLDFIASNGSNVAAHGSMAQRLLANGMNINSLRTNATLRKEEWLEFDAVVVETARDRLNGVADLLNAGLRKDLANGFGTTVVQWETLDTMRPAEVSMDGVTKARADRPNFELNQIPVPIVHEDFHFSSRTLAASRRLGETLDTTAVAEATIQVIERNEDILFNGLSSFTFGGGTIFGYTDHPNRNLVSLATPWSDSAITGEAILADFLLMIDAAHVDRMFGPYMVYVPTAYWVPLMEDFKANSDKTTFQRLMELPDIIGIKPVDILTADNVIMVQMTRNVVDMIVGQQPTLVEWESDGGFTLNFKVMSIMVPRIKATQSLQSGIVHLS